MMGKAKWDCATPSLEESQIACMVSRVSESGVVGVEFVDIAHLDFEGDVVWVSLSSGVKTGVAESLVVQLPLMISLGQSSPRCWITSFRLYGPTALDGKRARFWFSVRVADGRLVCTTGMLGCSVLSLGSRLRLLSRQLTPLVGRGKGTGGLSSRKNVRGA